MGGGRTTRPRFLVLGPMALRRDDGSTVVLSGRRDRLLLAVLLAAGDRSVPVGTITEAVWGRPPGPNALQARVSHLRRLVGPSRLRHDDGSYRRPVGEQPDVDALEARLAPDGR